jgi:hypothetical protein
MQPNSYFIKISGKANIPTELGIGHNYKVVMDCSITSESKVDNEDGTYDVIYKVEPITAEITKDNGETIKARDPRKNSTKIRNYLYRIWADKNIGLAFEDYYTTVTNKILRDLPMMVEHLDK